MSTALNILATFAFLFWFVMFIMSPMMFDAPGSENDKNNLVTILIILCYPIGISLLYWIFGGKYFGVSGSTLIITTTVIVMAAFSLFGYFRMLWNLQQGIAISGYSVAGGTVYYSTKPVENADSETFVVGTDKNMRHYSNQYYAWDKQSFFYEGKIIEGVSPQNLRQKELAGDVYWLNDTQVIHNGKVLKGAIPENFSGFDDFHGWTCSDNTDEFLVYSYGTLLPTVDKASFQPLNDFLAKDKNRIFKKDQQILENADSSSFQLLADHDFGRDKEHVHYLSTQIPFAINGIDPDTFEVLDSGYLRDRNAIYHEVQYEKIDMLEQADPDSFESTHYDETHNSDARDKNHYYLNGEIVGSR